MDGRIFWWGLWLSPVIWGVFLFIGLLKFNFEWLIIVAVAHCFDIAEFELPTPLLIISKLLTVLRSLRLMISNYSVVGILLLLLRSRRS